MKKFLLMLTALLSLAAFSTSVHAQVVPYYVEGDFIGNLVSLEAEGQARGNHFGNLDFSVDNLGGGVVIDTQTASDGSQLILLRVDLEFTITDAGGGLVNIQGIDYWQIIGGTGRFANAQSAGDPIISTFWTPEPVSLADPTYIPAVFTKAGQIDLGHK